MTPEEVEERMNSVTFATADRPMFFDRNGQPMTLGEWSREFANSQARTVQTTLVEGGEVITVWLGTEDDPLAGGAPLIFGTIVRDGHTWHSEVRTATEDDARRAHADVVAALQTRAREG